MTALPKGFGSSFIIVTALFVCVLVCGCGGDSGSSNCSLDSVEPGELAAWEHVFGRTGLDVSYSVQQTADGGYVSVGYTDSYGEGKNDIWLIKSDASGNETWNKTFGGAGKDIAYSLQQTDDGGYILAGETSSYGAGEEDVWLIKTDASGNETWNKTFGGAGKDIAYSLQQTNDGGYIVAGETSSYGYGEEDVWLIKTDSSGNETWNNTFGGNLSDNAKSVQQTNDEGFIIAGYTKSHGLDEEDIWLIKTDVSGIEVWNKTIDGRSILDSDHAELVVTSIDVTNSIHQTIDGGYILSGVSDIYMGSGHGDDTIATLIKTGMNGDIEWSREFDSKYQVNCDNQTSDGGYIVSGYYIESFKRVALDESPAPSGKDFLLIKTDATGNEEWITNYNKDHPYNDYIYYVQQTSDGGYIAAGFTTSYSTGDSDAWLIKVDRIGNKEWHKTFGGNDDDVFYSVHRTSDHGFIAVGSTKSYGTGQEDVWVIKTDGSGNEVWSRSFGGTNIDYAVSVQLSDDCGYFIVGVTESFGGDNPEGSAWLIKIDADGNQEWSETFTENDPEAELEYRTIDGGYIQVSEKRLIKTDAHGNEEWQRVLAKDSLLIENLGKYFKRKTNDSGFIKISYMVHYGSTTTYWDAYLDKFDAHEDREWANSSLGGISWGGWGSQIYPQSVQQTSDGGYIVGGYSYSVSNGNYIGWIEKYDPEGNSN